MAKETFCDRGDSIDCSAKAQRPDEQLEHFLERQELQSRLCRLKHKVLVLSGKGGFGKSTVAANLSLVRAAAGRRVGILDIDIHGPSIPKLLGVEGRQIETRDGAMPPVDIAGGLRVMSIGFMLRGADDAVIWRGPFSRRTGLR